MVASDCWGSSGTGSGFVSADQMAASSPPGWRPRSGIYVVLLDGREVRQTAVKAASTSRERWQVESDPDRWLRVTDVQGRLVVTTWATVHDEVVQVIDVGSQGVTVGAHGYPAWAVERGGRYDGSDSTTRVVVPPSALSRIIERRRPFPGGENVMVPLFEKVS